VLFDLGGVLIDWNPRYLYRSLCAGEAELEHFLAVVCDPAWNAGIDAGRSFAEAIREKQQAFPQYAELIGFWRSRWDEMLNGEVPGTPALLGELKAAGVPLFALTNWSAETFPMAFQRFGFLERFERIVVSGAEGLAKPDPALFRLAIERCALVPEETVFIDDSPANVAAALGLGFDALLFSGAEVLRPALVARGLLT